MDTDERIKHLENNYMYETYGMVNFIDMCAFYYAEFYEYYDEHMRRLKDEIDSITNESLDATTVAATQKSYSDNIIQSSIVETSRDKYEPLKSYNHQYSDDRQYNRQYSDLSIKYNTPDLSVSTLPSIQYDDDDYYVPTPSCKAVNASNKMDKVTSNTYSKGNSSATKKICYGESNGYSAEKRYCNNVSYKSSSSSGGGSSNRANSGGTSRTSASSNMTTSKGGTSCASRSRGTSSGSRASGSTSKSRK